MESNSLVKQDFKIFSLVLCTRENIRKSCLTHEINCIYHKALNILYVFQNKNAVLKVLYLKKKKEKEYSFRSKQTEKKIKTSLGLEPATQSFKLDVLR
jgi:hypothetical protein